MLRVIIGCLLAPFFISCTGSDKAGVRSKERDIVINNPTIDSELTLLMRKMYDDADSIKQSIKNNTGNITEEFIAELELVHTATPSDPKLNNPAFTAFNELLITEAKALKNQKEGKVEGFNRLVNKCIDCHKTFCPGPIPRIKKLKI